MKLDTKRFSSTC